jgi:SacI homology domain
VPNTRYKPKTEIPDIHTVSKTAFINHARAVTKKYGAVAGVNLANQHGTEGKLGQAYTTMVDSLPPEVPFSLFTFDFHKECGAANYQYVTASARPLLLSFENSFVLDL